MTGEMRGNGWFSQFPGAYRVVVLAACLSAFFGVAASGELGKSAPISPRITVRLYNYTVASRADVADMQTVATRIFEVSGIRTRWIQCMPILANDAVLSECRSGLDYTTIRILLMSEAGSVGHDVLGSTIGGTRAVKVAYGAGRAMHRDFPYVSCGQILGHVAAHEIGHVFLGTNAHSVGGIMRPNFRHSDFAEMARGHLLFLPQQSRLLQSKVLSLSLAPK
jgi:hypothetical protein